jgi:hypothetical protein
MEKIIADFTQEYPLSSAMAKEVAEMPHLPLPISIWISLNVSVLMAKLKRGDFNKYLTNGGEMRTELIDMFGKTYLQNIKKIGTEVWEITGEYELLKKSQSLKPDLFVIKLIEKYGA